MKINVMLTHLFHQDHRLNASSYTEALEITVKAWIDLCMRWKATRASVAVMSQDLLESHLHDHIILNMWPPNSTNLNQLDYMGKGVIEQETNQHSHITTASRKVAINHVMSNINADQVIHACQWLRSRNEAIIVAEGGYIKYKYNITAICVNKCSCL